MSLRIEFTDLERDPIADLMTPERLAACRIVTDFLADVARMVLARPDGGDVLAACPLCLLAEVVRLRQAGREVDARETLHNAYVLIAHRTVQGAVDETEGRR